MQTIIAAVLMTAIAAVVCSAITILPRMIMMANIKNRITLAKAMYAIDFVLFAIIFSLIWIRG